MRRIERTISVGRPVRVRTLAFSPVNETLAAGTEDGLIHLLEVNGGATSWSADQGRIQALAFSPDGGLLATGGTTSDIRLWVLDAGRQTPDAGPVLQGHEGPVNTLAFSPDGSKLASGSADHSVQIWDIARPDQSPILLQGHQSWVWSVAFQPDGETLASAGADKQVATWYVDLERMAERVCEATGRDLTRDGWNRFVGVDVSYDDNYQSCLTTAGITE